MVLAMDLLTYAWLLTSYMFLSPSNYEHFTNQFSSDHKIGYIMLFIVVSYLFLREDCAIWNHDIWFICYSLLCIT